MYRKLANVLRAIHILIIASIVIGFISAFFFPQTWIRICTSSIVVLVIILLLVCDRNCILTILELKLRKKDDPNIEFKRLIPELLKHFVPLKYLRLTYIIVLIMGAMMGICIFIQLAMAII